MDLEFSGEIIHWRGPAPFHFVVTPEEPSAAIEAVSSLVTYGWGAIPAVVRIGDTEFRTSLFPRGESYLVPIKVAVRRAERLELGDTVNLRLHLDADRVRLAEYTGRAGPAFRTWRTGATRPDAGGL